MEGARPWAPIAWWSLLGAAAGAFGAVLFWFDPAAHAFYPLCLFHRLTGLLCPGCGALRAGHQLLHGHLGTAIRLNPLVIVALPLLGLVAASRTGWIPGRSETSARVRTIIIWFLLGVMAALAVWRNLPGTPFSI